MDPRLAPLIDALPAPLQGRTRNLLTTLAERQVEPIAALDAQRLAELVRVCACSEFAAQVLTRDAGLCAELLASGAIWQKRAEGELATELAARLEGTPNEKELGERLRKFRRREMVRIAWRDLCDHAQLDEVTDDLSDLADACLDQALTLLDGWHAQQWGEPVDAEGVRQRLVVIGMGKLGAQELNFSSDIDLIFTYPEDGETTGGPRSTTNQEYFIRLGQRLSAVINSPTVYGFVFRVDMRLRPFGSAGPLAISFDAMENYYQVHGREWERYAMIKARVVAGDRARGAELMKALRPFVYRRYIDFGAFESLREMKAMIAAEVKRKGREENVKLGPGGIREVEFVGQAFQLLRGGRITALQQRPILTILAELQKLGMLTAHHVAELRDAYIFLRDSEHRIQAFADQQTQMLPDDAEGRARLAYAMGFADWAAYEPVLRRHMRRVHAHFELIFAAPQQAHDASDPLELFKLWSGAMDDEQAQARLSELGYADPAESLRLLGALRGSRAVRSLSAKGRERLDRLMPLLLGACAGSGTEDKRADTTLARLLHLLETITQRTAYLALLIENPMALSQLVRLCAASSWIAAHLTRYPQVLDELLDPRTLYTPPSRAELAEELHGRLATLDVDDEEGALNTLRHFKQANVLRVAAADVSGAVPLMQVSDHLTWIAEVVLEEALALAWAQLVRKHGRPQYADGVRSESGFAIIAYGKLGGLELGYGSDLDIVFLHGSGASGHSTDGAKPLDNDTFYARLAQRLIHILTTRTPSGTLYEADLRLRPSGNSGLLVASLDAFADYQEKHAWTWEHQALCRARCVAGDGRIGAEFRAIRHHILTRRRAHAALAKEVVEMREKMRANLSKAKGDQFDLKQDAGGIADIEFMVQYAILAWSAEHPGLTEFSDNIRVLDRCAEEGLLPPATAAALADAYRALRDRVHHLVLQDQPAVVAADALSGEREQVCAAWQRLFTEQAQAE